MQQPEFFMADADFCYEEDFIVSSPRIGVAYAGEDAKLPYLFFIKGNLNVSGKKLKTLDI
jgi:DNA-3-methyladenine glycosylase